MDVFKPGVYIYNFHLLQCSWRKGCSRPSASVVFTQTIPNPISVDYVGTNRNAELKRAGQISSPSLQQLICQKAHEDRVCCCALMATEIGWQRTCWRVEMRSGAIYLPCSNQRWQLQIHLLIGLLKKLIFWGLDGVLEVKTWIWLVLAKMFWLIRSGSWIDTRQVCWFVNRFVHVRALQAG